MNGRSNASKALAATLLAALAFSGAGALSGCAPKSSASQSSTQSSAGGGQAAPGPAIADPAKKEACFGNERTVETQAAAWTAQNPGGPPPSSVSGLVSAGVLRSAPVCPSGGAYSYDPARSTLTCSVHGHF